MPTLEELAGLGLSSAVCIAVRAGLEQGRADWDQLSAYTCGLDFFPDEAYRVDLVREFAERHLARWLDVPQQQALGELLVKLGLA